MQGSQSVRRRPDEMLSWLNAVRATSPRIGQRCAIKEKGKTAIMRKMKLVSPFITSSATCTEIDWRRTRCTTENLLHAFCLFHILWSLQQQHKKNKTKQKRHQETGTEEQIIPRNVFEVVSISWEGRDPDCEAAKVSISLSERLTSNAEIIHSSAVLCCRYSATAGWLKQPVTKNPSMLKHTYCWMFCRSSDARPAQSWRDCSSHTHTHTHIHSKENFEAETLYLWQLPPSA